MLHRYPHIIFILIFFSSLYFPFLPPKSGHFLRCRPWPSAFLYKYFLLWKRSYTLMISTIVSLWMTHICTYVGTASFSSASVLYFQQPPKNFLLDSSRPSQILQIFLSSGLISTLKPAHPMAIPFQSQFPRLKELESSLILPSPFLPSSAQ